jgi:hypothetical protein
MWESRAFSGISKRCGNGVKVALALGFFHGFHGASFTQRVSESILRSFAFFLENSACFSLPGEPGGRLGRVVLRSLCAARNRGANSGLPGGCLGGCGCCRAALKARPPACCCSPGCTHSSWHPSALSRRDQQANVGTLYTARRQEGRCWRGERSTFRTS